jgi:hypothetical protein
MTRDFTPTPPGSGDGDKCADGTSPPCPTPCITQIRAKVAGTKGKRNPANKRPDNILRPSTSKDQSLTGNPPVILVRGCLEVVLESVTTPPNQPVSWAVQPNKNSGAAPAITPVDGGKGAKLATDKTGSFSVIGTLGACKVVWNVVFVWVQVLPNTSLTVARNLYADAGSGVGSTSFQSGLFVPGQFAWEGSVKVTLVGGDSDGKLGISKIRMHVLQNGVGDTLTGNYTGGGTALEQPMGGLPVVDSNGNANANPYVWVPSCFKVTPNDTVAKRTVWTGDSPAGGFPASHANTGKPLISISGYNAFEASIASTSDDAPNAICVHAKTYWQANFAGSVKYSGTPPVGKYTKTKAKTIKQSLFHLISSGTGGQDACDAGFETFEPRFNGGTNTVWTP